jgi:hypothetical protein
MRVGGLAGTPSLAFEIEDSLSESPGAPGLAFETWDPVPPSRVLTE